MMPMPVDPSHQSASKMSAPAGPPEAVAPEEMQVDSITIDPTENDGYIVRCSKSRRGEGNDQGAPSGYSQKSYAFNSHEDMLAYVTKELGIAPAEPLPGAAGAGPALGGPMLPPMPGAGEV